VTLIELACQWLADTAIGTHIRESDNLFSVIETVHVLGIVVTAGTIAIVDLRVLGVLLRRLSVRAVVEPLVKITWLGFAIMTSTGLLLFWSEADKLYFNLAFRLKMFLLLAAGGNQWLFHRTHDAHTASWGVPNIVPRRAKLAAMLSLLLWSGIIVLGRAIAYL
jgi:hypothetical protein